MSEIWIIEPRDPLIVRDGRPFGATPGARARTLPFPFPSTLAGGVRTRAGQDENGRFDPAKAKTVKNITIRGPLLVQIDQQDNINYLVPAPNDALLMTPTGQTPNSAQADLRRLVPVEHDEMAMDLPDELTYPVGLEEIDLKKPAKDAPIFWHWEMFSTWLTQPIPRAVEKTGLGVRQFPVNKRSHVAIDGNTLTGKDGALFATSGLEFRFQEGSLNASAQYGLAVAVDFAKDLRIEPGIAPLGGERRLMNWFISDNGLPTQPDGLLAQIEQDQACRLVLLTPAYFEKGWLPTQLLQEWRGLKLQIVAAAIDKPVTVSGWDYALGQAKPTKRLAPAGSVYFVQFSGDLSQVPNWIEAVWMQCNSDDDELSQAGFGLTAVGCWDGEAKTLTINKEEDDA